MSNIETIQDFYKITLLVGESTIEYADKAIQILKQALVFSNPQIPTGGSIPIAFTTDTTVFSARLFFINTVD